MKHLIVSFLALTIFAGCAPASEKEASSSEKAKAKAEDVQVQDLSPEEKKNVLPDGGWFTWRFTAKPKLGTVIVKVQAFDKAGKQVKNYEVAGESGMPSMPYHDSGPVKFKLSKKGDYLLPVDLVMTGEWQLVIRVKKDKKEIYAGKIIFSL